MAKKARRPALPAAINGQIEGIIGTLDGRDRELRDWNADVDRRPRTDHADGLARVHEAARQRIDTAAAGIDAEVSRLNSEAARWRRDSWDEVAVSEAARRVRELRAAGLGFDEILDPARGFLTRELVEAVRREVRVDLSVAMKGARAEQVERAASDVETMALEAEIGLMDGPERRAAEGALAAQAAGAAVEALLRFISSPMDAAAQLRLGYALEDAGFVPAEVVPTDEQRADRARNSLGGDTRAKLDGKAVGWQADPMLTVRSR